MTKRLVGPALSFERIPIVFSPMVTAMVLLQAGFSPQFLPGSLVSFLYTTGLIPGGSFILLFHAVFTPGLLPFEYHGLCLSLAFSQLIVRPN